MKLIDKIIEKDFLVNNKRCYTLEQLNSCSFMKLNIITLNSIITSEIKLKDKYWFICRKLLNKEQNQQVTTKCAEILLHIYEDEYPNDFKPRQAIQAAKDYIAGYLKELSTAAEGADAAAAAAAYDAAYAAADTNDITKLLELLINFCTNNEYEKI